MNSDTTHKTQGRLLLLAALFLGFFAVSLTLSAAARARSWNVEYRWSHWIGYLVWLVAYGVLHRATRRSSSQQDVYLVPLMALLTGLGLLTIWRLTPYYGMRQTIWLALALGLLTLGLRLPSNLKFLRRYKYLWLTSGLLLTGLTLIFGTNPMGYGPRMWLGCCGIYLQPSEPLKLLLIVFLAAYFADWQAILVTSHKLHTARKKRTDPGNLSSLANGESIAAGRYPLPIQLQVLIPTLIMTGIALLLLLVQRDLGTASIFIFIFAVMVYLATGWRWIPLITAGILVSAGIIGYLLFDVVRLRIEAWINPWLDPAGRSYQIVQSLIAVANGGLFGRGPGMGSPTLVPVSHSDFIFAAIAEETGLIGAIGLLVLLGLLLQRGIKIALQANDSFHRLLAAGLTAFLVIQSVLIIGGNLRLLPLTGVTLPFVSYGGSSLLVSLVAGLLLFQISTEAENRPSEGEARSTPSGNSRSTLLVITAFLLAAISATALAAGWWAYVRGPDLLTRTDNPRRAISDRYVYRGSLLARRDAVLAETNGTTGDLVRSYPYAQLGPVVGYNHPIYGQAGLEASLDPTLRGIAGNDPLMIWWHHLLYGQPPPGLDVRLTLDLDLQTQADQLMDGHSGALILLNAETGEILVMASHPGFDPNLLDENWEQLIYDSQTPLVNRVTQGSYPLGNLGEVLFEGPEYLQWLRIAPQLRLPLTYEPPGSGIITPLQMGLGAAILSNDGIMPAPRLALSYRSPEGEWTVLPPLSSSQTIITAEEAKAITMQYQNPEIAGVWEIVDTPPGEDLTWYLGGTLPATEQGVPLALALVLEENNPAMAAEIGQAVLNAALRP